MDLLALADFNLVATHGGFGRASRAAGRPKATLSRRVAELENALGVRLIERGPRSLRLTEPGVHLHDQASRLLAEIEELGEAVIAQSETPRGRLRISAPVIFTQVALSRIAANFVQDYPEVEIEIVADERYVDPVEEGFDLVVRANPSQDDHLVGRCILQDERLVVASPHMAWPVTGEGVVWPVPVKAAILATAQTDTVWRIGEAPVLEVRPVPVLRLSSLTMVREAVIAGAGIGILPRMLASADLESGQLVNWGVLTGGKLELWVLHSSRRMASAKIKIFSEYLARDLSKKT